MLLRPQTGDIPTGESNAISQVFWDGCRKGELLYQVFGDNPQFNPGPISRLTGEHSFDWRKSLGRGSVYSWSVVWRGQTPDFDVPYAPAVIDIDEGYQMISCIVGCAPEDIQLGMRVEVVFHPVNDSLTLPYFRPERPGNSTESRRVSNAR